MPGGFGGQRECSPAPLGAEPSPPTLHPSGTCGADLGPGWSLIGPVSTCHRLRRGLCTLTRVPGGGDAPSFRRYLRSVWEGPLFTNESSGDGRQLLGRGAWCPAHPSPAATPGGGGGGQRSRASVLGAGPQVRRGPHDAPHVHGGRSRSGFELRPPASVPTPHPGGAPCCLEEPSRAAAPRGDASEPEPVSPETPTLHCAAQGPGPGLQSCGVTPGGPAVTAGPHQVAGRAARRPPISSGPALPPGVL